MVEVTPLTVMSNGTEELPSYAVAPMGVPRYTAFTVWIPKRRCVFSRGRSGRGNLRRTQLVDIGTERRRGNAEQHLAGSHSV